MTRQETIEKATDWMEKTAKDNDHGYDQIHRWGQKGDYDCSAAVVTAWKNAGIDLKEDGATYTGNLVQALLKNDFKDITDDVNRSTGVGLKRGDILFAKGHHVAMYCGGGLEVEASINEKGTATGGKPGDQTGREFLIKKYRNYPWTNVFRYEGGKSESKPKIEDKKDEAKPAKKFKVTAKNGLNIRRTPKGKIITAVGYETVLTYDDKRKKQDYWYPIIYKDIKGYVSSKYLKEA
jgi:cell wall-associated NlpC family hydrolase